MKTIYIFGSAFLGSVVWLSCIFVLSTVARELTGLFDLGEWAKSLAGLTILTMLYIGLAVFLHWYESSRSGVSRVLRWASGVVQR